MSYKHDFKVSVEEANYKLANDLIRGNMEINNKLDAVFERLDDHGRIIADQAKKAADHEKLITELRNLIADQAATIDKMREYLKTEYAKKQPAKSA